MSYAVHSKSLDALEWGDVLELVERGAEESVTLEFKGADIWDERAGKRGAQKAALPAIVAFANAYGGVLVLGMREERGPPGVAAELQPVADVLEKLEALQRAASDAIDPPLQGLGWKAVMEPGEGGRGVIVARAPASHLAPHGFGKPPEVYIRRFANSEPMTMRDMHSVFWEARTRQERVLGIRAKSEERLWARQREKQSRLTIATPNGEAPLTDTHKGAFVRCSAIFQEPLGVSLAMLDQLSFTREVRSLGADAAIAFAPRGQRRPIVDGVAEAGRDISDWSMTRDGTVTCEGFHEGRADERGRENLHAPIWYAMFATQVATAAHLLRRSAGRFEAPFELDMTFALDQPARCWIPNVWPGDEYPLAARQFSVGPYLVASLADLEVALKATNVDIHRGFGLNVSEPQTQTFDFIARL